jgi:hypothetical protein
MSHAHNVIRPFDEFFLSLRSEEYETKSDDSLRLLFEWGIEHEPLQEDLFNRRLPGAFKSPTPQAIRRWLSEHVDRHKANAVYLDTTTLLSAWGSLHSEDKLFGFHLWDLSTFINGVVLCERVFCCSNETLAKDGLTERINRLLGENVVVELP